MHYDVWSDLSALYASRGFAPTDDYLAVAREALGPALSYATPAMVGLCGTLFSSRRMIAFNLLQNAIDEAKGAARICVIADRYAPEPLLQQMRRHIREEMKHSAQFLDLIRSTGVGSVGAREEDRSGEVGKVLDFDDELRAFLCRVHSIEIRSWTMLRTYIATIRASGDPTLLPAIDVLEEIMEDEIGHVLYTGQQIDSWLREDPALASTLRECFAHTNRETWHDIASMANYLADNGASALDTRPAA